jgi:hypothetical protein
MATWHQQRNPVRLWHLSKWTLVTDPPNECRTSWTESTRAAAEDRLKIWKSNGAGAHTYILPPGPGGQTS